MWPRLAACQPQAVGSAQPNQEQADFFERNVRPVLLNRCSACHGEKVSMAGLNLTTPGGFLKGADSGPVVVPGDPGSSRLLRAIGYAGKIKMPPTGKLPDAEIDALTKWVEMGAPWPKTESALKNTPKDGRYWAFQPMREYAPPKVKRSDWVSNPIDQFVLAKLEENGLTPSSPAERLSLLRRAKMDLHGLPPTEEEVKEFLSDTGPGAYPRLVDRLLTALFASIPYSATRSGSCVTTVRRSTWSRSPPISIAWSGSRCRSTTCSRPARGCATACWSGPGSAWSAAWCCRGSSSAR